MFLASRPAVLSAPQIRFFSDDHHDSTPKFTLNKDGVAIPELVDSLEWLLDAPPNVHQFDEPPVSHTFAIVRLFCFFNQKHFFIFQIVVEIEHLENLKVVEE